MDTRYVKDKIKKLLVAKGVSDQKVSEELGMNKTYVQKIITGRIVPSLDELFCICRYFEISVSDFFSEDQTSNDLVKELCEYACHLSCDDLKDVIEYAKEKHENFYCCR